MIWILEVGYVGFMKDKCLRIKSRIHRAETVKTVILSALPKDWIVWSVQSLNEEIHSSFYFYYDVIRKIKLIIISWKPTKYGNQY